MPSKGGLPCDGPKNTIFFINWFLNMFVFLFITRFWKIRSRALKMKSLKCMSVFVKFKLSLSQNIVFRTFLHRNSKRLYRMAFAENKSKKLE